MPALSKVQSSFGPPAGNDFSSPVSYAWPSRFGPRHCGQSAAEAALRELIQTDASRIAETHDFHFIGLTFEP